MWDGRELGGRSILLHWEQGLGDTFNFIRYAPMVKAHGGRMMMLCQREVHRLMAMQTHLGVERWLVEGEELPVFDVHCPLLSLPGIFGTKFETIPRNVPYLVADEAMTRVWREAGGGTRFKSGACVGRESNADPQSQAFNDACGFGSASPDAGRDLCKLAEGRAGGTSENSAEAQ